MKEVEGGKGAKCRDDAPVTNYKSPLNCIIHIDTSKKARLRKNKQKINQRLRLLGSCTMPIHSAIRPVSAVTAKEINNSWFVTRVIGSFGIVFFSFKPKDENAKLIIVSIGDDITRYKQEKIEHVR